MANGFSISSPRQPCGSRRLGERRGELGHAVAEDDVSGEHHQRAVRLYDERKAAEERRREELRECFGGRGMQSGMRGGMQ
jgi:hypothetical protein